MFVCVLWLQSNLSKKWLKRLFDWWSGDERLVGVWKIQVPLPDAASSVKTGRVQGSMACKLQTLRWLYYNHDIKNITEDRLASDTLSLGQTNGVSSVSGRRFVSLSKSLHRFMSWLVVIDQRVQLSGRRPRFRNLMTSIVSVLMDQTAWRETLYPERTRLHDNFPKYFWKRHPGRNFVDCSGLIPQTNSAH